MENVTNIIDRFTTEVSPSDKKRLLMAYYDYVSLVGNLKDVIAQQGIKYLAFYESLRNKVNALETSPWEVENASVQEQQLWTSFVGAEPIKEKHNYCYVSVNHTSLRYKDESSGILSIPTDFDVKRNGNALPHRVERYVAAYPKEIKIADAEFVVDGKYRLKYRVSNKEQTLKEAFDDNVFADNFMNMLDVLSMLPDRLIYTDKETQMQIEKEVMASATVAPLENLILDTLSVLAEEAHQMIKKVIGRRTGPNYLGQAEKEQVIPSAVRLQDYINIRHLVHHQWDTLDGMGKFSEKEALKNTTVRRRFLDSYAALCDKPLKERLKSYILAGNDFVSLVTRLNPFVFIKDRAESNNKFIERFKAYHQANPEQKLYVETGIHRNESKKLSLLKKLTIVDNDFELIDKSLGAIADLEQKLSGFVLRRMYLEMFSDIEYHICQYVLFAGQNMTAAYAWNWLKAHKIITPQEADMWAEYRKVRNQLSHKYTDNELNQQILTIMPEFSVKALSLRDKISEIMPEVRLVSDNVYEAVHKNGKIVRLDYTNKTILSDYKKKQHNANAIKSQVNGSEPKNVKKTKIYTEEYPNGVSLTISGTDIVACRLGNGVTIDMLKNQLTFEDETKVYYATPHGTQIVYAGQERIFADKSMMVNKCVKDGKIIFLGPNDRIIMSNRRSVLLGKNEEIKEENWFRNNGQKMNVRYVWDRGEMRLHFNDGTVILLNPDATKVWHQGVELNYAQRQNFADSYADDNSKNTAIISAISLLNKEK